MDQEFEEHECNCMPVGGDPNAPTCYDDQCHNYATMQECRKDRCHPGCRNQRIQVCSAAPICTSSIVACSSQFTFREENHMHRLKLILTHGVLLLNNGKRLFAF